MNFSELLIKKEKVEGRRIPLDEIAREIGVSRMTLSRLTGPIYHSTSTDIIDKLCHYFHCKEIGELVEYREEEKKSCKALSIHDIKLKRHCLLDKIVNFLESRLPQFEVIPMDFDIYVPTSVDYFDAVVRDANHNRRTIVLFRPQLYYTDDLVIKEALKYEPHLLIIITMDQKIPGALKRCSDFDPRLRFFRATLLYDEINQDFIDMTLDELA